jgi:hypothetical protein
MNNFSKSVCVIGAGCSGLTSIKNLIQAGMTQVVCFERNSRVGGNWIYTAGPSHASVCETTHIISSKKMSEFTDFPMPDDYPDYPSHRQVLDYFEAYAEYFNLLPYIRFNTSVVRIDKLPEERWSVSLDNGETHTFDYLFLANGHHAVPRMPELPGQFEGEIQHAHEYKTNQPYRDKRVLVIGAGNSACDCAVEISRVAAHTAISIRRPQYIIPKFFMGKPSDTFNDLLIHFPDVISNALRKLSLWIQVGDYRSYGLEPPAYPITGAHPTLNSELLYRIRHGRIQPVRGISDILGREVRFADGRKDTFDVIIAATGYKIVFPFFDKSFLDYEEATSIPLYLRMLHPDHPSLFFIGLFQPQGCIWPLSDLQAKLAANMLAGRIKIQGDLRKLAEQDAEQIARDFVHTPRHAIEVHFRPFYNQLKRLIPTNVPDYAVK